MHCTLHLVDIMGKCELLTELGLQVWEAQINCNCITAISIQCLTGVVNTLMANF